MKPHMIIGFFVLVVPFYSCRPDAKNSSMLSQRGESASRSVIVVDPSKIADAKAKSLAVHLKAIDGDGEIKNEYPHDKENIREMVKPGQYQFRLVALGEQGAVVYDSEICYRKKVGASGLKALSADSISHQTLTLVPGEEKALDIEFCVPSDAELKNEPYLSEFSRMHQGEFEGPGWPPLPRRYLTAAESVLNTSTVSATLGVAFWSYAKAETKASTSLAIAYKSDVMFVKHALTPDTPILLPGSDELAYEEGVQFVGQCNYSASVTGAAEAGVSLGVSGPLLFANASVTGGHTVKIEKATAVQAQSKFFSIREHETVDQIKARCKELFTAEVEASVKQDLMAAVTKNLIQDNRDNGEAIMQAAIVGPSQNNLGANGHGWNVYKAELTQDGSAVTITGRLARTVKLLPDSNFCYSVKVDKKSGEKPAIESETYNDCSSGGLNKFAGQITNKVAGGSWEDAAKEIAQSIALEAWTSKNPQ